MTDARGAAEGAESAFGVEHEGAFLRGGTEFADRTDTGFAARDAVVADLPRFPGDHRTGSVPDVLLGRRAAP